MGLKGKKVACAARYTQIIDDDHNVWVFENNNCDRLGLDDVEDKLVPTKIHHYC
jgi:hypothetical protein